VILLVVLVPISPLQPAYVHSFHSFTHRLLFTCILLLSRAFTANLFVHFEAVGPLGGDNELNDSDLPPYLIPGSPEESFWRKENPQGYQGGATKNFETGSTVAHVAAQQGDLQALSRILAKKAALVHAQDENGWTPMHEGARGGHVDIVKVLYERGARVNQRSDRGRGGTPLFYAKETHGEDHPVVKFLVHIGGLDLGPEL